MPIFDLIDLAKWTTVLVFVAAFATIVAIALPFLRRDERAARLKGIAARREEVRSRTVKELERERLSARKPKRGVTLMRQVLERLNLAHLAFNAKLRARLAAAGWRHQNAAVIYLFLRITLPFALAGIGLFMASIQPEPWTLQMQILVIGGGALFGFFLPPIMVKNQTDKRRQEITLNFPDALDLLVICTEAGLSIDAAFARVTEEMTDSSAVLAQEMGITTAEQAFLGDRRKAYMNFAERTGVPAVRALATALVQAEKYGTPVSVALRVLSKENRDERLSRAEKKAAALPAQLTVPMIVFFLPVLLAVIVGPAIIRVIGVM